MNNPWPHPTHSWIKQQNLAFVPGHTNSMIDSFIRNLALAFEASGHHVLEQPEFSTQAILTTAEFGKPLNWRSALLFTARRTYRLAGTPTIITVLHATPEELQKFIRHFERVLPTDPPDPADYAFPGLSPKAYKTLFEQGTRGGPLMALARLIQSQSKSIRNILIVGDKQLEYAYLFDLVGAHPRISALDPSYFYRDIVLRLATTLSTSEVTDHRVEEPRISQARWRSLKTPSEMQFAAAELGKRRFFTDVVLISDLVHVPSISTSVASQYSEGCFATWDPNLSALIATVTGSARPVEKDAISDDDLAVITGVREDGFGVIVRHVEGKRNDPPSSESVEMIEMDASLPRISLDPAWGAPDRVPIVRSKLHGHRGVAGFNPRLIEFVPLEPAYYHYPVSCATAAQARGIISAFARSEALLDPADPRQVVFTVLPGHGLVVVEKWVSGMRPFQFLYECMDSGDLLVDNQIPQGLVHYEEKEEGRMELLP